VKSFSPAVEEVMQAYHWPGNIRELENLVLSLVITSERGIIELSDLPSSMLNENASGRIPAPCREKLGAYEGKSLKEIVSGIEREIIQEALNVHGSVAKVAEMFGVNRTTIFRKLQVPESSGTGAGAKGD
jgi:DNA-binding NtrC family response regulator